MRAQRASRRNGHIVTGGYVELWSGEESLGPQPISFPLMIPAVSSLLSLGGDLSLCLCCLSQISGAPVVLQETETLYATTTTSRSRDLIGRCRPTVPSHTVVNSYGADFRPGRRLQHGADGNLEESPHGHHLRNPITGKPPFLRVNHLAAYSGEGVKTSDQQRVGPRAIARMLQPRTSRTVNPFVRHPAPGAEEPSLHSYFLSMTQPSVVVGGLRGRKGRVVTITWALASYPVRKVNPFPSASSHWMVM